MKTVSRFIIATVIMPLTLGATSAFAYGHKEGKKSHHGKCGGSFDHKIMRQLDLSDEQKAKLKEMHQIDKKQFKAEMKTKLEARQATRQAQQEQLQSLILADNFDQAAAHKLAKAMLDKQLERKVKLFEKQHQMMKVLTPEQKAKFVELQNKRTQKCQQKAQQKSKNS